ncbi:hypothetical protein [uncultured Aquitalea sp.]|uniref:DUF488 family protein, N3 subclade n=1 Tax=uncultured Aquitalea sp. TaxID=540272 RepID=UPI0025E28EFC|nr:hypothetical protein [uncultured Aquitalea sp.]
MVQVTIHPAGDAPPPAGQAVMLAARPPAWWPPAWRAAVRCLPGLAPSPALSAWALLREGRAEVAAAALRAGWEAEPARWRFLLDAARHDVLTLLAGDCPVQQAACREMAALLNERLALLAGQECRASPVCYAETVEAC